ncbi:MAG: von Willebrand factor type A domain-containing protein [Planctomycetota bacterium]
MNESFYSDEIDPELEARIVAMVLGEVSDFERDQLEQLIEARPELLQVRKQLEELHGLLNEVGEGELLEEAEAASDETPWTLDESKRNQLLSVIEGEEENPVLVESAAKQIVSRSWMEWANARKIEILTASACIVICIGLFLPARQAAREAARLYDATDSMEVSSGEWAAGGEMEEEFSAADGSVQAWGVWGKKGQASQTVEKTAELKAGLDSEREARYASPRTASPKIALPADEKKPRSEAKLPGDALAALQGTLGPQVQVGGQTLPSPYYLTDDVQYFPSVDAANVTAGPVSEPALETVTGLAKNLPQSNVTPSARPKVSLPFGASAKPGGKDNLDVAGTLAVPELPAIDNLASNLDFRLETPPSSRLLEPSQSSAGPGTGDLSGMGGPVNRKSIGSTGGATGGLGIDSGGGVPADKTVMSFGLVPMEMPEMPEPEIVANTATVVPDGGSVLLGGIKREAQGRIMTRENSVAASLADPSGLIAGSEFAVPEIVDEESSEALMDERTRAPVRGTITMSDSDASKSPDLSDLALRENNLAGVRDGLEPEVFYEQGRYDNMFHYESGLGERSAPSKPGRATPSTPSAGSGSAQAPTPEPTAGRRAESRKAGASSSSRADLDLKLSDEKFKSSVPAFGGFDANAGSGEGQPVPLFGEIMDAEKSLEASLKDEPQSAEGGDGGASYVDAMQDFGGASFGRSSVGNRSGNKQSGSNPSDGQQQGQQGNQLQRGFMSNDESDSEQAGVDRFADRAQGSSQATGNGQGLDGFQRQLGDLGGMSGESGGESASFGSGMSGGLGGFGGGFGGRSGGGGQASEPGQAAARGESGQNFLGYAGVAGNMPPAEPSAPADGRAWMGRQFQKQGQLSSENGEVSANQNGSQPNFSQSGRDEYLLGTLNSSRSNASESDEVAGLELKLEELKVEELKVEELGAMKAELDSKFLRRELGVDRSGQESSSEQFSKVLEGVEQSEFYGDVDMPMAPDDVVFEAIPERRFDPKEAQKESLREYTEGGEVAKSKAKASKEMERLSRLNSMLPSSSSQSSEGAQKSESEARIYNMLADDSALGVPSSGRASESASTWRRRSGRSSDDRDGDGLLDGGTDGKWYSRAQESLSQLSGRNGLDLDANGNLPLDQPYAVEVPYTVEVPSSESAASGKQKKLPSNETRARDERIDEDLDELERDPNLLALSKKVVESEDGIEGREYREKQLTYNYRGADHSRAAANKSAINLSAVKEKRKSVEEYYQNEEFQAKLSAREKGGKSQAPAGLEEKLTSEEAFSTFSLHVSDVSFKLAFSALSQGRWPETEKIRIEEFVNALDYGDPLPSCDEKVVCQVEQGIHPFLQQRNVMRVSMSTAATGRSASAPLRLTLLLDNSGSMERPDRRNTVSRAFALLMQQLQPGDQVTLISFASKPRLLADGFKPDQADELVQLVRSLPSEGGTNIESALQLAFEKAVEQKVDGAQNRVVLLTDGAVNLGDANPAGLAEMVTDMRESGIAFDAAGISAQDLNDEVLEALTRKGDGRYYLLDSIEQADDGFAKQIAGALRPSAKNVKVQIEFNPRRVERYKLLGYEKHRLKKEDFRNDAVDAAEMAAEEAGVAVYQFEPKADGFGDVGSVSVRFQDMATGKMVERRWPIPYEPDAARPDQAAPSLRLAIAGSMLAAKLRGEPLGETVDLKELGALMASLPAKLRSTQRVQQLEAMIELARQIQP